MTFGPHLMEPLLPEKREILEDMARGVLAKSAALGGRLHPLTQAAVVDLLRIVNSYYSNLIEGHSTHPVEIEQAMRQDYSRDPAKRELQQESLAHIACQKKIDKVLADQPETNPASREFICWIHKELYKELPEEFTWVTDKKEGERVRVYGGQLRTRYVEVGRHVGPPPESIGLFLDRFETFYNISKHHGLTPLIAAGAAHHRLMWIHPFLDGNGRAARLFTDAYLKCLPLPGYGLWNISRGLARRRDDYMTCLSHADAPRRNDLDGRGNLSREGLVEFCRFFLETSLDQIDYMGGLLDLDGLRDRIAGYIRLRTEKLIPPPKPGGHPLKVEAAHMLFEVLARGEVSRGDLIRVSGLAERTGRQVLSQLIEEGLLVSDLPKGPVRLTFPTYFAGFLFQNLYPNQMVLAGDSG
ncbi:MAG: Fic family protein [Syntrophotaleaceae bacterium]